MSTVTAITLRNRTDEHIAERDEVPLFRTRGPKQRAPCWTLDDKMAMLDTVLRGFVCGPIYIIQDIENNIDDVFDGAHRCEAVFEFMDGKFVITKGKGKHDTIMWETSPLREYIGKKFKELPLIVQKKFKDYSFYINTIESDTANDPAALGLLWKRLSMAGKKLSNVETQLQTHALLIKDILEPCSAEWLASSVFPSKESTCCKVENTLQKLLALSEKDVLPSYNSMEDLVAKWQEEVLGKTVESIDFHTKEKKESLIVRLKYMRNLLRDLQDRNVLHDEHGKNIIDKSKTVPLQIILGRLANFFPMISLFRRVADHLCPELHRILSMNPNDLCKDLNVASRNAIFQKKLIEKIDTLCKPYSNKERRCFTLAEKRRKVEEQGGICPECNKMIQENQRSDGDHIIEFCKGGTTSYDNLQILHKICHEQKNMKK